MDTRRIDHVTVVTPDAGKAHGTFQRIFEFRDAPATATGAATAARALIVGGARIEFVTPTAGAPLAAVLAAGGEGMAELCLEVARLDDAAKALTGARVAFTDAQESGRRILRIDPSAAHGVRLTLIERR